MATTKTLIKPELLVWARKRANVTLDDAAKAANVTAQDIEPWEADGKAAPSLNQFRCLAAKYHFPLAVVYLPKPPTDFAPLRDFRRLLEAEDASITANLAFHIRSAYERRELALELHHDLNESPRAFRLKAKLTDSPEAVGESSWADRLSLRSCAVRPLAMRSMPVSPVEFTAPGAWAGTEFHSRPYPPASSWRTQPPARTNRRESPSRRRIFEFLRRNPVPSRSAAVP